MTLYAHDGFTYRGPEIMMARATRAELDSHMAFLELHACSECNAPIATCLIHQLPMRCESCGIVF